MCSQNGHGVLKTISLVLFIALSNAEASMCRVTLTGRYATGGLDPCSGTATKHLYFKKIDSEDHCQELTDARSKQVFNATVKCRRRTGTTYPVTIGIQAESSSGCLYDWPWQEYFCD